MVTVRRHNGWCAEWNVRAGGRGNFRRPSEGVPAANLPRPTRPDLQATFDLPEKWCAKCAFGLALAGPKAHLAHRGRGWRGACRGGGGGAQRKEAGP